ncbi:hypothetical protein CAI21_02975 [Alkalilimnicola ehrlichii]|uniref:Methyl-accepting chemotaxis protein n=1 Tax=Alkalilimnicola ehrlichii TaxID=351052 RepID=A0A3E0X353_9GAMM|nr:methyl-accepting chemotaxis protein [Alkalilimnicola ehrlichii]RFA30955.1 hypothetical protein CAI21_02975 [Alkalilimnicola ehrlichii]RFA38906.1 hypothetical protein CAL65_03120 [Alkalilimnicola ehrlichii]
MTLRAKLLASFSVLVILLLVIAGSSLFFMQVMRMQTDYFADRIIPGISYTKDLHRLLYQHHLALDRMLETTNASEQRALEALTARQRKEFDEGLVVLIELSRERAERVESTRTFQGKWEEFKGVARQIERLVNDGQQQAAAELLRKEGLPFLDMANESVAETDRFVANAVAVGVKTVAASQKRSIAIAVGLLVLGLIIAGFVCWLVYRSVTLRLSGLRAAFSRLGTGDLTVRMSVQGKDEIAELASDFNGFSDGLNKAFNDIRSSMERLHGVADKLQVSFKGTAGRARSQQAEMDAVATAMNEMAVTIKEVARSAEDAAASARDADEHAVRGRRIVEATSTAIRELNRRVLEVSANIDDVRKSSDEIGTVLQVIRGIAEQTNLLALNAAIEAARAGDQGRGFAVVADEVRTLASRTQTSAQEIVDVIESLQSKAEAAVKVAAATADEADEGVRRSDETASALGEIVEAVSRISDKNAAIAASAEEQSAVAEEMDGNIVHIHDASGETLREADSAVAESETLNQLAQSVVDQLSRYKLRA